MYKEKFQRVGEKPQWKVMQGKSQIT